MRGREQFKGTALRSVMWEFNTYTNRPGTTQTHRHAHTHTQAFTHKHTQTQAFTHKQIGMHTHRQKWEYKRMRHKRYTHTLKDKTPTCQPRHTYVCESALTRKHTHETDKHAHKQ